jgi:hypothetical protein
VFQLDKVLIAYAVRPYSPGKLNVSETIPTPPFCSLFSFDNVVWEGGEVPNVNPEGMALLW